MRIWILASEMPHELAGGIARYVENFARLLGAAGHEVVVIARTLQACDQLLAPGVRLIGVLARYAHLREPNPQGQADTHPAYPYNVLGYWPALSYQLAEEVLRLLPDLKPPDVIESQEYGALPYYLIQRKLTERTPLEKIPLVVQLHGPTFEVAAWNQEPRYRFPEYWIGQMEKFCMVAADALLAPSAFLARRVEQILRRPLNITRIPYPLPGLDEAALNNRAERGEIVYVGRLEVRKGVFPLVQACARLWSRGIEFRLTMVGGGVEFKAKGTTVDEFLRQRYRRWIESGHLRLAGQCSRADVMAQLQRAWAVVIPSLWENFPNTCMEAMSVGQVVLASQAGGQAEMIAADSENGFLFDWECPGDFERQLEVVLGLGTEERQRIAQRAQTRIATLCGPELIMPQRLRHYEEVIARHTPQQRFPVATPMGRTDKRVKEETTARGRSDGEEEGLLSVIIPYYNLGDYIKETLTSVLAASYRPVEVVIVNDGSSTARSLEVLQEIEQRRLSQVRVVHTENQGLAATRNTGAEAARGEFLAFLDADDVIEPEFFTRAIEVLHRYANVTFVYSWVRYFEGSTGIWPTWNAEFPYLLGHNMLAAFVVLRRSAFLHWARNKPALEYSLEDHEGWIGLVAAGGVGVSLCHPLVRYRVRAESMYRSVNRNQLLYLYDLITQYHPEAYQEWGNELFNLQNANGPGYLWNHPAVEAEEPPSSYVTTLQNEHKRLVAEVQTLGKAWEDQGRYIASQRTYIEGLEERCHELMTVLTENGKWSLPGSNNGIPWGDYELGGRIINRVRRTWLARRVLRSPGLKRLIKKTLRM